MGSGLLAQPVNALSSAAFLVAGLWIVSRGRWAATRRMELRVFGLAVAGNAVGGLVFHGLQTPFARWIHDVGILSVLVFIVVFDLARFRGRPFSPLVFGVALGAFGLLLAVPASVYPVYGVLGAVLGLLELAEYRRELPRLRTEGFTARRLARLAALAAVALGATAFFVGRSGGPLCDPGSAFQWHAVWHVLGAAAMALYAYAAVEPHPAAATV